jgi:hypothetical protein
MLRRIFIPSTLLLAAVLIVGCSTTDNITAPQNQNNDLNQLFNVAQQLPDGVTPVLAMNIDSDKHLGSMKVTFHRAEDSFGKAACWYFDTEMGEKYEALFKDSAPKLMDGMVAMVSGTVVKGAKSDCDIAPVFNVESFKVVYTPGVDPKMVTVEGAIYNYSDSKRGIGCPYFESDNGDRYYPEFKGKMPTFEDGTRLEVSGNLSLSKEPACGDWPVLAIEEFKVLPSVEKGDNNSKLVELFGSYHTTDEGCSYLQIDHPENIERKVLKVGLEFGDQGIFDIMDGTLVKVVGYYDVSGYSSCDINPGFQVVEYSIVK